MALTPAEKAKAYRERLAKNPAALAAFREKEKVRNRARTPDGKIVAGRGYPPAVCQLLASARFRAKRDGYPFTLTHDDITIPEFCPILGHKLVKSVTGKASPNSPSLDKVDPNLGYIPGNVRVISHEANRLKDANTIATLERLLAYCRGEI